MKKIIVFLAVIFIASFAFAQYNITLHLQLSKEDKTNSSYFFASNLNGWSPSDSAFKFVRDLKGDWILKLPKSPADLIQYKITRGTWDAVESSNTGEDVGNRVIKIDDIKSDTTIIVSVSNWKDNFSKNPSYKPKTLPIRI